MFGEAFCACAREDVQMFPLSIIGPSVACVTRPAVGLSGDQPQLVISSRYHAHLSHFSLNDPCVKILCKRDT